MGIFVTLLAGIMALLSILIIEVGTVEQNVSERRYLDCVMSPMGDEILCKQVTVTDPPYKP